MTDTEPRAEQKRRSLSTSNGGVAVAAHEDRGSHGGVDRSNSR